MQTRARLAAAYGEDDLGSSVEELEGFARELDPTMRESRTKLQTKNVDLQVWGVHHADFIFKRPVQLIDGRPHKCCSFGKRSIHDCSARR